MLQQTQVARVVGKYGEFLDRFPTLEDLASAPLGDVLRAWQGLGYNTRAKRLRACAVAALASATDRAGTSGGNGSRRATLPATVAELQRLPGVGPYTARAVMIFAHNADVAAVDANVRRVLTHELGLPSDLAARNLQRVADQVLPAGRARDWHNALMDYGALVLTARATGIAPISRQGPFPGSRRWCRARIVRLLLEEGPRDVAELRAALDLDAARVDDAVAALEADGLVSREGTRVALA
jgi:A/G-specific adenine glycosylase